MNNTGYSDEFVVHLLESRLGLLLGRAINSALTAALAAVLLTQSGLSDAVQIVTWIVLFGSAADAARYGFYWWQDRATWRTS